MPVRCKFVIASLAAIFLSAGVNPGAQSTRGGVPAKADDKTIIHVLNRLGFGPSSAAIERVRRMGLPAYVEEQLHPSQIADTVMAERLGRFTTLTMGTRELAEEYFLPALMERRALQRRAAQDPSAPPSGAAQEAVRSPEQMARMRTQRLPIAELSQQKVLRAAYSERQLEEVLVDFWFNHFNVFVGKGQVRLYLTEYERGAIRPQVLGKFRDLLGATAQSPAMLFYLDNWQSTAAADAPTSAQPPIRRDPQLRGRPQPRRPPPAERQRAQQDGMVPNMPPLQQMRRRGLNENYARELMELHTLGVEGGYTQQDVQEVARAFTGWTIANPRLGGSFRFDARLHDDGEKIVLGRRIKAGGGQKDGEQVLDLLAQHPSTARFIATKLARRFVADDPPPALVARAADRFRETDGNIREVVRTIVSSPEFFAPETHRAKVKSPFEFVVSAVRAGSIEATNALPLVQALRDLGMPLYGAQPPTGYADRANAWVNTGALLNRMNFAVALTNGRMRLDSGGAGRATGAPRPHESSRSLLATAFAGDISDSTASTVARATTASQKNALILGSPEFQTR